MTIYGSATVSLEYAKKTAIESVKDMHPFEINMKKLNYSDDFFKTVFIEIKENKNLTLIYQKLQSSLKNYGNYYFKPHISLIYKNTTSDEKKKILKEITLKSTFIIDRIFLNTPGEKNHDWYDIPNWESPFVYSFPHLS